MRPTAFFIFALCFSLHSFSQETTKSNTIDNQFREVYKKSNNYQEYKVVLKKDYASLHTNVLDSVKAYNKELTGKNSLINSQKSSIAKLESDNKEINSKLADALQKENSISLFGIQLSKGNYTTILFSIIVLLIIALVYFIYKFKNSNVLTVAAKSNLEETESEFNLFRKKSLEREQKLRRQLQDEIIKNRNN